MCRFNYAGSNVSENTHPHECTSQAGHCNVKECSARINTLHWIPVRIQILMQRLRVAEVPGERIEPVEGSRAGVIVPGAEVLKAGELVGLLSTVKQGR